jgi:hypothetical protein
MSKEFKYQLTSFCIKHARLSLPYAMRELFPKSGDVTVFDTKRAEEFVVHIQNGRYVTGVETFLAVHQLEVNDAITIRLNDEGGYSFTPLPATQRFTTRKSASVDAVLSDLASQQVALSEPEIRRMHDSLPKNANLRQALSNDERFELVNGRWQLKAQQPAAPPRRNPPTRHNDTQTNDTQTNDAPAKAPPAVPEAAQQTAAKEPPKAKKGKAGKSARVRVTPYPLGVIFPGDAGLNSQQAEPDVSLQSHYRHLLSNLGYRVEGLAHGQMLAHADLGRRHHTILIHILPEKAALDWAQLMARRREINATYLAIFGHAQDLLPLTTPTDLARASLWAFHALERLEALMQTVPLSPIDLESFFEHDGLFERGLERFEAMIAERVKERGAFSEVLSRLATLRAPSVFLLDDITDSSLSREQALKMIEPLMHAPFHLISKVDTGEYCLHLRVSDALMRFSEYAVSLRQRLPHQRLERLTGVSESVPEEVLLTELAEEPTDAPD